MAPPAAEPARSEPSARLQASLGSALRSRPASLDGAGEREVEARLEIAISRARRERGLQVPAEIVEAVVRDGHSRVIVASHLQIEQLARRLADSRYAVLRAYRAIPFAAFEVGPEALLRLVETDAVTALERDELNRPTLFQSVPLIGAEVARTAGHDGSGFAVAVLDTGIDGSHPFLAGSIVDEACFSTGSNCPNGQTSQLGEGAAVPCPFDCDHGTHVAGIVAGMDPATARVGVAPGASLLAIQIYSEVDGQPGTYSSDIVAALEHVYWMRNFHAIAAVNLSLGGETLYASQAECDAANPARRAAIDLLRSVGIATVVSSGNEGFDNVVSAPACISSAISVGATTKSDVVASFSNSSPFLRLLAPGRSIESSVPGGAYALASGTSMAAPHVAGAWACLRGASPDGDVDRILTALQTTGVPIVDARNLVTTPRIDVGAALDWLLDEESASAPSGGLGAASEALADAGEGGSRCGLVGLELLLPLASCWRRNRARAARGDW